jgi:hypothetical protein
MLRLVADLDESVDGELVTQTIAVERSAVVLRPDLAAGPTALTVSVSDSAHEQALDAVAFALRLPASD